MATIKEGKHTIIVLGKGFSAAHSDAFDSDEPLHGHNYSVEVEVESDELKDGMVMDFRALKKLMNSICKELDHKTIIGKRDVSREENGLLFCGEYRIPKKHAVVLPYDRATCERLSEYFFSRLEKEAKGLVSVRVDEYEGAGARFSR